MRRIPKQLTIAGHTIDVEFDELDECYGLFDPMKMKIVISNDSTKSMQWETFCHELVEAINFFAEADLEHKSIQVFGLLLAQSLASFKHKK
jgi:hypothetical protein|tara:strand:+ start:3672 stop:3944 length:273 start_codon:yes stop_codon:yes gene_type:complete